MVLIKQHSLSTDCSNPFVCLSDITGEYHEHNVVIYNPNVLRQYSTRDAMNKLSDYSIKYFNMKIPIHKLSELLASRNTNEFVKIFREYYFTCHPEFNKTIEGP